MVKKILVMSLLASSLFTHLQAKELVFQCNMTSKFSFVDSSGDWVRRSKHDKELNEVFIYDTELNKMITAPSEFWMLRTSKFGDDGQVCTLDQSSLYCRAKHEDELNKLEINRITLEAKGKVIEYQKGKTNLIDEYTGQCAIKRAAF